jgi:HlyD family secretion protein
MKKNRKRILWGLGIAVVLLLTALAIWGRGEELPAVQVESAAARDITERVAASGKIQPEVEVKITAQVSGEITQLPVKEGDVVKAGDLLVQINPDTYISALNRAEAALNTAQSNLAAARAQAAQAEAQFFAADKAWQRAQSLFADRVLSQADFDQAQVQFRSAEAAKKAGEEGIRSASFAIRSAEATVSEARVNLTRTTLRAPQAGTVTALVKELGESVQGTGFTAGEVIMKISDLGAMEVNVEVNESDIVRVELGDSAEVLVDAYADRRFMATVTEIGNTALNAGANGFSMDQVTNFSVKVRLLEESYRDVLSAGSPFRPGMSASVEILTAQQSQVLSVPIQAVTSRGEKEATGEAKIEKGGSGNEASVGVFVWVDGKAVWRPVVTGIQDSRFIEVREGLTAEDVVITGPYEWVSRKLEDGDGVTKSEEQP